MNKLIFLLYLVISSHVISTSCQGNEKKSTDGPIIGIDLGTTYSCVGIFKNGKVEIIPNELGNRITPSIVAFMDEGRLVGEAAKNQASINPKRTIYSIKRLIGRNFNDKEVQQDIKLLPYEVINKSNKPYVQVEVKGEKKVYSPEEISAMILTKMKTIAENYLGQEVKNVVITVPAYFNDSQRQSTKDAGLIAGLNVLRIISEPTAAAIAYGLDRKEEKNILVFDLGGGTFDVSLLTIDNALFEVRSTNGDTHLGGEDFDNRVIDYFAKKINTTHKIDLTKNKSAMQKLKSEVEKAKRTLSSSSEAVIEIDQLVEGVDFRETLSRAKFDGINSDLFKKTILPVEQVLKDAGMEKKDIHEVVLVGGSTRIPKIQQLIKDFFNNKEPNKGVNPDEAVAYGAAVQGGILGGEQNDSLNNVAILDATSLTLGIETVGGVMTKIIPKGTIIPAKKTQQFTTYADNQTTVTIHIFEGERPLTKDNHSLGKFDLTGIPPAPRGTAKIDVIFEVDENSILKVSAVDTATNNSESITVTNESGKLSQAEINKMLEDAEKFKEEDKIAKEKIDAKNALEHYIFSMTNTIEDKNLADKLDEKDKEIINEAVKEHKEWLSANPDTEKESYEMHLKDLQRVCDPIIAKVYKQNNSRSGNEAPPEDLDL